MRILLVSNLYPPRSRGGAEMIARTTAEELVRLGHDVSVLSTDRDLDGVEVLEQEGVRVHRYTPALPYHILDDADQPLIRRLLWHGKDLFGRGTVDLIDRVIEDVKPDVIVTHNLRGMGLGLTYGLRACGVPWVHVLHDVQLLVPSGAIWADKTPIWQRWPFKGFYQYRTRSLMGSPDLIVAPTHFVADAHTARGFFKESEVLVLQNPVAKTTVSTKETTGELVSVGQLTWSKGVDVLIRANALLERPMPLTIIGEGPELSELMALAAKNPDIPVTFTGRIPHQEVFSRMASSAGVVLSSRVVENCPGVILEACRVGARVVGPDAGGVPELISEAGCFEPGQVRSLAQALSRLQAGEVPKSSPEGLRDPETYARQFASMLERL